MKIKYQIKDGLSSFTFKGKPYDVKTHNGVLECEVEEAEELLAQGILTGKVAEKGKPAAASSQPAKPEETPKDSVPRPPKPTRK